MNTIKQKVSSGRMLPAPSEVIVLDDDDIEINTTVGRTTINQKRICLNYLCESGVDLMKPPIFCMSYYHIKGKPKGHLVCRACYELAANHFEQMSMVIQEGKSILSVPIPDYHEVVTLDSDSDEDACGDDELLDENTMKLLEEHLDEIMEECKIKYDYDSKMNEDLNILERRIYAADDSLQEVRDMASSVQKQLDFMLISLTTAIRPPEERLPEISIGGTAASPMTENAPADLPKRLPLVKPPLQVGQYYFAERKAPRSPISWVKVKLEAIIPPGSKINDKLVQEFTYQVCREFNRGENRRFITGKCIAYSYSLKMMLEIGARVVALFTDITSPQTQSYYPGIVGEFPSPFNRYRYLIFFDDGYALYVHYKNVFLIYDYSADVWDDVCIDSRAFIRKYLTEYPNRSMVKFELNQKIRTEYKGRWYETIVLEVDGSLVKLHFQHINREEGIYRGSRRLKTMYQEEQAASNRLQHKQKYPRARNRPRTVSGAPYVQYSSVRDDTDVVFVSEVTLEKPEHRAVARKSTSHKPTMETESNQKQVFQRPPFQPEGPPPGKIVYYTPRKPFSNNTVFKSHKCSQRCQKHLHSTLARLKGYGPLAKPLLSGFYRMHYKAKSRRPVIIYTTPCGRNTRNMEELHHYLRLTESDLTVDMFSFDPWVRCLAEFILEPDSVINKDLSEGLEHVQVPVVNYVDQKTNDFVNYATQRMPMEGVHLNLDPEFLCGCDCEDDCSDKTKCACWKLTNEGAKYLHKSPDQVGYVYRRLKDPLITGIYECNSRCKCTKTCLNRVVQNPLQHKLQIFMTSNNRGWGIRCINDIPQGSFICIYAGSLLTDQMANEGGANASDEYYAELDFIESAEMAKQDYEQEAYRSENDDENEEEETSTAAGSKKTETAAPAFSKNVELATSTITQSAFAAATPEPPQEEDGSSIRSRLRKRDVEINYRKMDDDAFNVSDEEESAREPLSFNPEKNMDAPGSEYPSVRTLFGRDESVYVMDAKSTGNLGRFLNHSCSPNMFVQNVFVDTHDPRFPWVSFFAMHFIRAGTELTWNYSYDVASVDDKVLYCNCGSAECKGRLL